MADECAPENWQRQFPSMLRFDATGRVHQRLVCVNSRLMSADVG
jgi:hypothetical protein